MNKTLQHLFNNCIWPGVFLFFAGFIVAGYIPPPSPAVPVEEIALHYQENRLRVLFASVLMMAAIMFLVPWTALIGLLIYRTEPKGRPLITILQAGVVGLNAVGFIILPLFMSLAAFRPDRAAEVVVLMHDATWFGFVTLWPVAALQSLTVGLAVVSSPRDQNIFPRWVGFYNLWLVFIYTAGSIPLFFKTGHFAWNGIFPFWLPLTAFGLWYVVMYFVNRHAIEQPDLSYTDNGQ